MKILIVESRLVNIVSKFIGELYELGEPGGNEILFINYLKRAIFLVNYKTY
jgi:hypothetical protein